MRDLFKSGVTFAEFDIKNKSYWVFYVNFIIIVSA